MAGMFTGEDSPDPAIIAGWLEFLTCFNLDWLIRLSYHLTVVKKNQVLWIVGLDVLTWRRAEYSAFAIQPSSGKARLLITEEQPRMPLISKPDTNVPTGFNSHNLVKIYLAP